MNHKKVQSILDDAKKIKEFSELNKLTMQAAEEILRRLLEKPEISEEAKKYIFVSLPLDWTPIRRVFWQTTVRR